MGYTLTLQKDPTNFKANVVKLSNYEQAEHHCERIKEESTLAPTEWTTYITTYQSTYITHQNLVYKGCQLSPLQLLEPQLRISLIPRLKASLQSQENYTSQDREEVKLQEIHVKSSIPSQEDC